MLEITHLNKIVEVLWFEPCKRWYGGWHFIHWLKKWEPCEAGRQKLNSQLSILVDESEAGNPFISHSDKVDVNKEMNVIEDEKKIIMKTCSFFNRLSCVKEKSYIKNTLNL